MPFNELRRQAERNQAEQRRVQEAQQAQQRTTDPTEAARQATMDKTASSMNTLRDSAVPQVLDELKGLHQAARPQSAINTNGYSTDRQIEYGKDWRGRFYTQDYGTDLGYEKPEGDWSQIVTVGADYESGKAKAGSGFVVEAHPDGSIDVIGAGRQNLSASQAKDPEAVGRAIEKAYDNPIRPGLKKLGGREYPHGGSAEGR